MVRVVTDLGDLHDLARNIRVEEVGSITSTNIQGALDQLASELTVPNIRKPPSAATVAIVSSDIEVGIDTRTTAVTANLPSAVAWAAANPTGLDLTLVDYYGNAGTNNITPSPFAGDSIDWGGITPTINANFGNLRLRPDTARPGWYVRGIN